MSSVDPSQLPGLVSDVGYKVMLESYNARPPVYPSIFEMVTISPLGPPKGFSERTIVGATEPDETEYGAPAPHRTMAEGWQAYCKIRKLQEELSIQEEMYLNPDGLALVTKHITERMRGLGGGFASRKEKICAAIFNRGAITAGDPVAFKGSFDGHPDPNNGLIYDGKPFFAASGNAHPFAASTATGLVNHDGNALTAVNLNAAYQLHVTTNAYSESNEHVGNYEPTVLVVPPALLKDAAVLMTSAQLPGTAQNDANYLQAMFRVVPWWALTDTDGWFLGTAGVGVVCYDSGEPIIDTSLPDRHSGDMTFRIKSYIGAHVKQWRPWSAHATSTS